MKQVSLDLDSFYIRSKNCTSHFKQATYVHQILEKFRFRKNIQEVYEEVVDYEDNFKRLNKWGK